jgi:hypothetical protein
LLARTAATLFLFFHHAYQAYLTYLVSFFCQIAGAPIGLNLSLTRPLSVCPSIDSSVTVDSTEKKPIADFNNISYRSTLLKHVLPPLDHPLSFLLLRASKTALDGARC